MRVLTRVCGILGGLLWVARWVLAQQPSGEVGDDVTSDLTLWAGALLLALAVGGTCAGLASASAPWLRAFTGVAAVALGACVLLVARDAAGGSATGLDAVVGAVASLGWLVALARSRPTRPRAGSHAR